MVIKIKQTFNDLFTVTRQLVLFSSQNTEAHIWIKLNSKHHEQNVKPQNYINHCVSTAFCELQKKSKKSKHHACMQLLCVCVRVYVLF